MLRPSDILDDHIPSLTAALEREFNELLGENLDGDWDWADAAVRQCSCGIRLEGFDGYHDHLRGVFLEAEREELEAGGTLFVRETPAIAAVIARLLDVGKQRDKRP